MMEDRKTVLAMECMSDLIRILAKMSAFDVSVYRDELGLPLSNPILWPPPDEQGVSIGVCSTSFPSTFVLVSDSSIMWTRSRTPIADLRLVSVRLVRGQQTPSHSNTHVDRSYTSLPIYISGSGQISKALF